LCGKRLERASGRVGLHFIPPGQPWRNGYFESFNSRIRDECLNIDSFWSLTQARFVISDWKHDYNPPPAAIPPWATYRQPAYAATCTCQWTTDPLYRGAV